MTSPRPITTMRNITSDKIVCKSQYAIFMEVQSLYVSRLILCYHHHLQGLLNSIGSIYRFVFRFKFQDPSLISSTSGKYSYIPHHLDFVILFLNLATQFSSGYLGGFPIEFLTQVVRSWILLSLDKHIMYRLKHLKFLMLRKRRLNHLET